METPTVTVARTVGEVAPQAWESLASGRTPFHQLHWFRGAPAPGSLRLLVAHRGECVVGLLPLYLVDEPTHYYHSPREILCGARERALFRAVGRSTAQLELVARGRWSPCAIAVSPFGYRGGIIGDSSDPSARDVAVALVRAADACCRREGVRALLYYGLTTADDSPLVQALADKQVPAFVVGAHCDLRVTWPTLDAYFAALGERGRRLRSKYRQAERDERIRWRTLTPEEQGFDAPLREAAIDLFSRTARSHGDALPPVALYRALLGEWPGPRHLLVGESADGRLRSALLVLQRASTLYPKCFGATARGDYFHLTFAKTIELAINLGATRIAYGGGSHEAKLLRGVELVWLLGAIVPYDVALHDALKLAVPEYSNAKQRYFSELAARYSMHRRVVAAHGPPPSFPATTSTGALS